MKMFETKKIKGYYKLNSIDKLIFDSFLKRFYEAWEYPEEHKPVAVNVQKGYIRVDLNDGSWLHVKANGEWY